MKTVHEFTNEELNIILAGLSELPFKVSQPMINRLVSEFKEQTEPKVEAEPVKEE